MNTTKLFLCLTLIFFFGSTFVASRRSHKIGISHKHKKKYAPIDLASGNSTTFNVMNYGAKGNGVVDDTNAFVAAWADACNAQDSIILIPSDSIFLIRPISFSGRHCLSNITFQLDGKIVAPSSSRPWGKGMLQWLKFTKLKGITITDTGVIEGQGSAWWAKGKMTKTKPTAVRFYGSSDVTVTGITIQNSPQTHLKFDNCIGVHVFNINISSPGDSPNTDGIHLQNSQDVLIHNSSLSCGDDCISIQTGCSRIYVHNVKCGPGHGISIGSLGKDGMKACVSNITIHNCTVQNTLAGVRIKTWQGGSGLVQGVMFSNIQVSQVKTPIIIDQYYCNGHQCTNKTSGVAVSDIFYKSIKGTYMIEPVRFACSDSTPCTGITLAMIDLKPVSPDTNVSPFCWKVFGRLQTTTTPPIDCLKEEKTSEPISWSSLC